jgi:hypothetical protein
VANPIRDAIVELIELERDLREELPFFRNSNLFLANSFIPAEEKLRKEFTADCKLSLTHEEIAILGDYLPEYIENVNVIIADAKLADSWRKAELPLISIFNRFNNNEFTGHEQVIEQFVASQQLAHKLIVKISGYYLESYSLRSTIISTLQTLALDDPQHLATDFQEFEIELAEGDWKKDGDPDLLLLREHEQKTHELKVALSSFSETEAASKLISEQGYGLDDPAVIFLVGTALEPIFKQIYGFIYEQIYNVKLPLSQALANADTKFKAQLPEVAQRTIASLLSQYQTSDLADNSVVRALEQISKLKFAELTLLDFKDPKIYELELRELSEYERDYYHSYLAMDYFLQPELAGGKQLQVGTSVLTPSSVVYNFVEEAVCGRNPNWNYFDEILSS